jgi:hypothetical protein
VSASVTTVTATPFEHVYIDDQGQMHCIFIHDGQTFCLVAGFQAPLRVEGGPSVRWGIVLSEHPDHIRIDSWTYPGTQKDILRALAESPSIINSWWGK